MESTYWSVLFARDTFNQIHLLLALFLHAKNQVGEMADLLLVARVRGQLFEASFLHNLAVLKDCDSRALLNCSQAMRYHDRRSILHDILESFLHLALRDLVKSTRGFIEK